jgi:hypothetical protein
MKYEYTQTYFSFKDDGTNHSEKLNEFGNQEWELISSLKIDDHNIMYLFKREKQTKTLLNEERKII